MLDLPHTRLHEELNRRAAQAVVDAEYELVIYDNSEIDNSCLMSALQARLPLHMRCYIVAKRHQLDLAVLPPVMLRYERHCCEGNPFAERYAIYYQCVVSPIVAAAVDTRSAKRRRPAGPTS